MHAVHERPQEPERPITIEEGTNVLVGSSGDYILQAFNSFKNDGNKKGKIPELWDGKSSERIVDALMNDLR